MTTNVDQLYMPRITRSRDLVEHSAILRTILDESIDPAVLERFLIEYCSLGVQITQPVEDWIRRAGTQCIQMGVTDVGKSLTSHAPHEAGHHLMFVEDTKRLVELWNDKHAWRLDADALIARPPTRAMQHYISLHEETISGSSPFAQVAIEFEIERLSVVLVPKILAQVTRVLGSQVAGALGFLRSHGELDVGHTRLNRRIMEALLTTHPESAADLARVGAEAMFVYMAIFDECHAAALRECAHRGRPTTKAEPFAHSPTA